MTIPPASDRSRDSEPVYVPAEQTAPVDEIARRRDAEGTVRSTTGATDTTTGTGAPATTDGHTLRQDVVAREKEEFGGFKFGAAFFGWLTATGTAVLLAALVSGAGTAIGLGATDSADDAADAVAENADTVGIIGAIALVVVLFVAYLAGGYVAGRMARFSGAKQGVAVWIWAVVIAIVVAIVVALGGTQFNVLANLNSFPRIPVDEGDLTLTGIITAVVVAAVSLLGAVVGGLAGMRYHRKVDRAGLGR